MATSGSPLPAYFRNPSEAILYAKEHKFALYKGMHAFAKWQRELGDRFVAPARVHAQVRDLHRFGAARRA